MKQIPYSEIFGSIQGEGWLTGYLTTWIRLVGCNLKCDGFGQKDPTNPETYDLPYQRVDFSKYEKLEDLPVFEKGCDSSYSWYKDFKRFVKKATIPELADKLVEVTEKSFGMDLRKYNGHPRTGNWVQLGITGGEPMLYQKEIGELLEHLEGNDIYFQNYTIETNGTKPLEAQELLDFMDHTPGGVCFSISPKLYHVSGEKNAVLPEVIDQIANIAHDYWIKFVVNSDPRCWDEIDECLSKMTNRGDIWVMPVGATSEQQQGPEIAKIATEALRRGFYVSARVHTYLWGNQIGT